MGLPKSKPASAAMEGASPPLTTGHAQTAADSPEYDAFATLPDQALQAAMSKASLAKRQAEADAEEAPWNDMRKRPRTMAKAPSMAPKFATAPARMGLLPPIQQMPQTLPNMMAHPAMCLPQHMQPIAAPMAPPMAQQHAMFHGGMVPGIPMQPQTMQPAMPFAAPCNMQHPPPQLHLPSYGQQTAHGMQAHGQVAPGGCVYPVPTCKELGAQDQHPPQEAAPPAEKELPAQKLVPHPPLYPPKNMPPTRPQQHGTPSQVFAVDDENETGPGQPGTHTYSVRKQHMPVPHDGQGDENDWQDDGDEEDQSWGDKWVPDSGTWKPYWDNSSNDDKHDDGNNDWGNNDPQSSYGSAGDTNAKEWVNYGDYGSGNVDGYDKNYDYKNYKSNKGGYGKGKMLWNPKMTKGWEMKAAYLVESYIRKDWERCDALIGR